MNLKKSMEKIEQELNFLQSFVEIRYSSCKLYIEEGGGIGGLNILI